MATQDDEDEEQRLLLLAEECGVSEALFGPADARRLATPAKAEAGGGGGVSLFDDDDGDDELDLGDDGDSSAGSAYDFLLEGLSAIKPKKLDGSPSSVSLSLPASFDEALDLSPYLPAAPRRPNAPSNHVAVANAQMLTNRVIELEAQIDHLTQSKRMVEAHLKHERERAVEELKRDRDKFKQEMDTMKAVQLDLEGALKQLRERMDDQRSLFRDLDISDGLYMELVRRSEDQLSLREFVAVRTYAQIRAAKDELEKTRRSYEDSQDMSRSLSEQLEVQSREAQRRHRSAEAQISSLQQQLEAAEARAEQMEHMATQANDRLKVIVDKERTFDVVEARMKAAEAEVSQLKDLVETQATALAQLTTSENTLQTRAADLVHQNEILALDKAFLTKEVETATNKANQAERELERSEEKARELKRRKEELSQALEETKQQARQVYEEKLNKELSRLREEGAKELVEIKKTSSDMMERENKTLREIREEAVAEAERLRVQLSELSKAHEEMLFRLSRTEATYETSLAEARGDVKMKAFELSRTGVILEEKSAALRQAEQQVSMLREQAQLHRQEFLRMEASSSSKFQELQSALNAEREKVRAYEALETQLDDAIVRTGIMGAPGHSIAGGPSSALAVFEGLPTAPQRRVRHALQLAQKLGDRERELTAARRQVDIDKEDIGKLRTKVADLERLVESATQPGRYVVELVREKDHELDQMRTRLADAQLRVEGAEAEARRVAEEKAEVERELQHLLTQRTELKQLRLLIEEMQAREVMSHQPLPPQPPPASPGPPSSRYERGGSVAAEKAGGGGSGAPAGVMASPLAAPHARRPEHIELLLQPPGSEFTSPRWHRTSRRSD